LGGVIHGFEFNRGLSYQLLNVVHDILSDHPKKKEAQASFFYAA